tara:strand:- start:81 stop:470 length:390 start_codon:yes stop_codon:yes gene_type:complete
MKANTFTAPCTNCGTSMSLKGGDWGVWLPDLDHSAEHVQRELAHLRELVVRNSVICHGCHLTENGIDEEDAHLYAAEDDDAARQERAMQAGMAGGCAAYNDAMGSPLGGQTYCSHCLKDFGSGHHCCDC